VSDSFYLLFAIVTSTKGRPT